MSHFYYLQREQLASEKVDQVELQAFHLPLNSLVGGVVLSPHSIYIIYFSRKIALFFV